MVQFTDSATIRAAADQVSTELDGEAVILGLRHGVYYGLNDVGARIWGLLQQPTSVDALCAVIISEYEVEPERCRVDVRNVIARLADEGLVTVVE
jgi:hypothetical protein